MAAEHVERIGARIRERRDELGLSRRQVVNAMGGVATENDLYRWERGQHRAGDDKLAELARVLTVDVSYFLVPEPEEGTGDLLDALTPPADQVQRIEAKLDDIITRLEHAGFTYPTPEMPDEVVDEAVAQDVARHPQPAKGAGGNRRRGRAA